MLLANTFAFQGLQFRSLRPDDAMLTDTTVKKGLMSSSTENKVHSVTYSDCTTSLYIPHLFIQTCCGTFLGCPADKVGIGEIQRCFETKLLSNLVQHPPAGVHIESREGVAYRPLHSFLENTEQTKNLINNTFSRNEFHVFRFQLLV